jgi:hypothetical protein
MSLAAGTAEAGSAEVAFATARISTSERGDVDVVVVAHAHCPRTMRRVIHAAPNRVLHRESIRVLQHERDDLVSEGDAFGGAGVRNHDVDRQTAGVPRQRIRPDATHLVNLGERRTDGTSRQDGSDLEALLVDPAGGQKSAVDPQSRGSGGLPLVGNRRRRGLADDWCRHQLQTARLDVADNRLGVSTGGGKVDVSSGRKERGGRGDARGQDFRRFSPSPG